jgi:hypothetical protein
MTSSQFFLFRFYSLPTQIKKMPMKSTSVFSGRATQQQWQITAKHQRQHIQSLSDVLLSLSAKLISKNHHIIA